MRLLVSAPCGGPRFVGEQLLAAARRIGHDAALFDHPAARDPTLELPAAAWRLRPDQVLLVEVDREDPATLDVLRSFGARVTVWLARAAEGTPAWRRARTTWIAGAADAVFVTDAAEAEGRRDGAGRPARVIGRGFDPETLGLAAPAPAGVEPVVGGRAALRASDDPLVVRAPDGAGLVGVGDAAAFPAGVRVEPLDAPERFAGLVAGRTYVAGGRPAGDGPPSVFDDVAAARALGGAIERWEPYADAAAGPLDAGGVAAGEQTFEARLRVLLAREGAPT